MSDDDDPVPAAGYRTYEVYQRERVAESSNLLAPRELIGDEMLHDPYRLLTILREHHPCYRDWVGNRFWISRYDDVTSIFTDDANFETRSNRWFADHSSFGRDLGQEVAVRWAHANRIDDHLDEILVRLISDLAGEPDLSAGLAERLSSELWANVLDLPPSDVAEFAERLGRLQRAGSWEPRARVDGAAAARELVDYFEPLVARRRVDPGDDLISAAVGVDLGGAPVDAFDVVATIWEADHQTVHGGLANLWCLLLTNPEQLDAVRADRRLVKFAWLEALRHSPPVHSARRFARHEVERFGRLLPAGAMLTCSAAAANRDPRVFADPDRFLVERRDLCQREPRGQYRADGLPSGISFGTGRPSVHPAVPKDRPRSQYALVRDVVVRTSMMLLDTHPTIRLASGATPDIRALHLGEMHTCWRLPVEW